MVLPKRSLACFLVILRVRGFQKGIWDEGVPVSLVLCSALGADATSTSLIVGYSISLGWKLVSRIGVDHWLVGTVERSDWEDGQLGKPTVMGVGALERMGSCKPSPYMLSRNVEAERIWDSDGSVAAKEAISDGWLEG